MAQLRVDFRYRINYVEKRDTRVGTVTNFQVGEKDGDQWVNFRCTIFDDVPFQDGDRVRITEIGSIEVKQYKGKVYYNAVVKAELEQEDQPRQESKDAPLPFDL